MKPRSKRYQSCAVLATSPLGRRVWQFDVSRNRLKPSGELRFEPGKPLPKRVRSKDWQALFQPSLHVAWLPTESAFVRAIQLPSGDPAELGALVEFQLDKISPLPVAQVVWTAYSVPHPDGRQQTALVIVAPRATVEEFLNQQVVDGFVTHQMDLPLVRAWRALQPTSDGLWLLFETSGERRFCLAGWYLGGVWRDVSLLSVAPGPAGAPALASQLGQTAWAGEMEGWLTAVPPLHVVADSGLVAEMEPVLASWSGHPVRQEMPQPMPVLALASAAASLTSAPPPSSLVPTEWSSEQRQKSVDRLWMGGLGALAMAYVVFVFLFLIALNIRKYQRDDLRSDVTALGVNYTNTLQLKAQVGVLQEQVALRFAALEAWRAAVNLLPASATLTQLDFQRGQTLALRGTVSPENTADITKFNSD
ncbi:MAG: hypothetical protein KIT22_19025, partial [Verrucomicrobiae bacterium]|nr:hypothetical protein [Verrucomicrobiae bacterium]